MTFKPTYLYIKQHSVTKKCYFGKTTRKNPIKYLGSGKYWKRHLKIHGKEFVETLWFKLFTDQSECTRIALLFSEQQDIVKSELWLNIIPENGIDGAPIGNKYTSGFKHTPETCAKRIGNKNSLGYKQTLEHRARQSASRMGNKNALGKNLGNKHALGYKHTPETRAKMSESRQKFLNKEGNSP